MSIVRFYLKQSLVSLLHFIIPISLDFLLHIKCIAFCYILAITLFFVLRVFVSSETQEYFFIPSFLGSEEREDEKYPWVSKDGFFTNDSNLAATIPTYYSTQFQTINLW